MAWNWKDVNDQASLPGVLERTWRIDSGDEQNSIQTLAIWNDDVDFLSQDNPYGDLYKNNETDYLMIKEVHFNRMQGFCSNFPKSKKLVTFTDVINPFNENPETASSHERIAYTVMTLSDFMDWMEPDSIKSYVDENESKQTSEIKQQAKAWITEICSTSLKWMDWRVLRKWETCSEPANSPYP